MAQLRQERTQNSWESGEIRVQKQPSANLPGSSARRVPAAGQKCWVQDGLEQES